jgi:hypothetical protein
VRADFGADPGEAVTEDLPNPVDGIGRAGERAARQDKDGLGAETINLLPQRLR